MANLDALRQALLHHLRIFFTPEVAQRVEAAGLQLIARADVANFRGPGVALVVDLPVSRAAAAAVNFGDVALTVLDAAEPPDPDWVAWPASEKPYWWLLPDGGAVLAWGAMSVLRDLLLFEQEAQTTARDGHGRFPAEQSPYLVAGLGHVPWLNELAYALAALMFRSEIAAAGWQVMARLKRPPMVFLSHDCDVLMGNDRWTQLARLYRLVAPLKRGRLPDMAQLCHMAVNALRPRRYYLDDVRRMVEAERALGYRSIFYFLNGRGGRLHSRTPDGVIREALAQIPSEWEIGVHYNYDTFRDSDGLARQIGALERLCGRKVVSGRAHYLRFDARKSPQDIEAAGIRLDESIGFPYVSSHRAGIAGPFRLSRADGAQTQVWELPLTFMDVTVTFDETARAASSFEAMVDQVARVGGAIGLLVHPGTLQNPEVPGFAGRYDYMLRYVHARGFCGMTPATILDALKDAA